MPAPTFAKVKDNYASLWSGMVVSRKTAIDKAAVNLLKKMDRYEAVEKQTGVPAAVIACLHNRESDADFNTYLGNGDPLGATTIHEPKNRGPFPSWEAGAIDALKYDGLNKVTRWTVERALYEMEAYNGWGYFNKGAPSPYLWAGTNQYTSGKYVADGRYDSTVVDKQLGCAPLLAALMRMDASLDMPRELGADTPPPPDIEAAPKPVSAPVPAPPDIEPTTPQPKPSPVPQAAGGIGLFLLTVLAFVKDNPFILIGGICAALAVLVAIALWKTRKG